MRVVASSLKMPSFGRHTSVRLGVYRRGGVGDNSSGDVFAFEGDNYIFFFPSSFASPHFALKDADGYIYLIYVVGDPGLEQLVIEDGYPPGTFDVLSDFVGERPPYYFNFAADFYFRIFSTNPPFFHALNADDGILNIESPGVVLSTPEWIATIGLNYKFEDLVFYLKDNVSGTWRHPLIVADSNHQNAQLQLT